MDKKPTEKEMTMTNYSRDPLIDEWMIFLVYDVLMTICVIGQHVVAYNYFGVIMMPIMILGYLVVLYNDGNYLKELRRSSFRDGSAFVLAGWALCVSFMWVWGLCIICFVLPYRAWKKVKKWVHDSKEDVDHMLGL
ncbi:MAG: hypothetical protein WC444_01815 [Candidatus Paceibacterota bacterium]